MIGTNESTGENNMNAIKTIIAIIAVISVSACLFSDSQKEKAIETIAPCVGLQGDAFKDCMKAQGVSLILEELEESGVTITKEQMDVLINEKAESEERTPLIVF